MSKIRDTRTHIIGSESEDSGERQDLYLSGADLWLVAQSLATLFTETMVSTGHGEHVKWDIGRAINLAGFEGPKLQRIVEQLVTNAFSELRKTVPARPASKEDSES